LRCPRTHSGRKSGPGSGAGNRRLCTDAHGRGPRPRTSHGQGAAKPRCVGLTFTAELSVHVPASARCPAGFPGRGGRGRTGAVMARVAVRESVTLAGRAERARPPAPSSLRYSAPGTRAEMWLSSWSARSSATVSGTAGRVLPGDGRGHFQGWRRPSRGERSRRAGDAGAASCGP
jgi:hypothetical protein